MSTVLEIFALMFTLNRYLFRPLIFCHSGFVSMSSGISMQMQFKMLNYDCIIFFFMSLFYPCCQRESWFTDSGWEQTLALTEFGMLEYPSPFYWYFYLYCILILNKRKQKENEMKIAMEIMLFVSRKTEFFILIFSYAISLSMKFNGLQCGNIRWIYDVHTVQFTKLNCLLCASESVYFIWRWMNFTEIKGGTYRIVCYHAIGGWVLNFTNRAIRSLSNEGCKKLESNNC